MRGSLSLEISHKLYNNVFFHLMFLSVLVLGGSGGIGNFAIQVI